MKERIYAGGEKEHMKYLKRNLLNDLSSIDQDHRSSSIKKYLQLIVDILPKSERLNLY